MKIIKPAINLRERLKQFINWEQVVDKLSSQGVNTVSVDADRVSINQTQGALSGPSDTVLDMFVYDTTRDSDGGAWRKTTSNTSWYNETLNTDVRGSRREFPQVAVIVTTQGQLTIYDADQPDLPMWMVFKGVGGWGDGIVFENLKNPAGQLAAINGTIVFGDEQAFGLIEVSFISELARSYTSGTGSYGGTSDAPLVNRNTETRWRNNGYNLPDRDNSAVDLEHNVRTTSVAMAVLPGAPVDRETRLPRPTIAVGKSGYADNPTTDTQRGGLEIIKHHLNVYNEPYNIVRWSMDVPNSSTYYYEMIRNMYFDGEFLYFTTDAPANLRSGGGTAQRALCRLNVSKADHDLSHDFYNLSKLPETFINATGINAIVQNNPVTYPYNQLGSYQSYVTDMDHEAMATDLGLIRYFDQFPEARDAYHSGGICYIDNRHVSGWLCNDWKFSLCSDTKSGVIGDAGEIDLLQGKGINPNVDNFTGQNAVISNDTQGVDPWIMIVDDGANAGEMSAATIDVTTVIGRSYTVFFDKISTTTNFHFSVFSTGWINDAGDVLNQPCGTIPGRDSCTFVATSTTSTLAFAVGDTGEARYDNIKMIETEHSTELVTNQNFKSNIDTTDQVYNGGWTQGSGGVISNAGTAGIDSSIKITSGGGTTARAITRVKTTPGETYVFSARAVERTASQYKIMVRSGVDIEDGSTVSDITQSVSFVAVEEETMLELYAPGAAGTYATYNNPSCKPAIADGAGNVHKDTTMERTIPAYADNGHVEKRPVAPGAELMGFYFPSPLRHNSSFRTPSRSDLKIGTQDFYVTSWVFHQDGELNIQQYPYRGSNPEGWRIVLSNADHDAYIVNGDFSIWSVFTNKAPQNQWYHFAAVRTYGHNWTIYIDGFKHATTGTLASEDYTYTNGEYGIEFNGTNNNALALTRVGTGRLTGEHIRKMYDDERYLFNPGAKCTLHGDDHTANCVAYDPTTGLTHVGTDSGTSTFNGLVRVDQSSQPANHIAAGAGVVLKS